MQQDNIELLGLVSGFVSSCAYAPQAWKILRERSAKEVSLLTYSMVFIGALMWGSYGLLRGAPSIVLWNGVSASLALMVVVLKLRDRPAV